ncbi:MAG: insulinase family protein [Bacteroidales bacterium]|nr:insulinase family protein [Bacteroidales bacterium]
MKRFLLTFLWLLIACSLSLTAQDLKSTINNDPNVKIGKLANGLTYYIRENKMPANHVEFRLAVNAGSNQEEEPQRGLAHFTEHMAFNGIKGFPGNEVVSKLQSIGVSFGGGLNAYTSFDETVFMISMPTDDAKNVDMGLNILRGWADGLLYNSKEIDQERGVITEEYRMYLGADKRMQQKYWPVLFRGMKYAEREPIGLLEVINGFEYQTIKDFYHDWYRPDLQAVIVVGDINAAEIEQMIIKKFSKIKPAKNPREKVVPALVKETSPQVVICTDKEAMGSNVEMVTKLPHIYVKTVGDYRESMVRSLFNMMIRARLSEMRQNPNTPFLSANINYSNYLREVDAYELSAQSKENKIDESMKALIRENNRVLKYGFLESELKRAKEEMMDNYERAAKEIDKTNSEAYASQYVSHFLKQTPIPGAKRTLKYAEKYLEGITLEEVNALAKQWVSKDNLVVIVTAPEQEGVKVPTEQDIRNILNDKSLENVTPYVDTYKDVEVIDVEKIVPGSVVSTKNIPEVEAKELTLSNGIKVLLKKTDYKNDEILFSAKSRGGISRYYECDIASAQFAPAFIMRAGIGELDYSSLSKKMKGKKVSLAPSIDVLSEGISGSTTPKDMEFFFQYLNAFFTNVRKDTNVYTLVMSETKERINTIQKNPLYKFIGKLVDLSTQSDPYYRTLLTADEEFIKSIDYERAWQLYHQRFANPADFVFTFVGNFDEAEMTKMLETYVASLPTTDEMEDFNDVEKGFPEKSITTSVYAGTEEQSWAGMMFSEEYDYTPKNNMILNQIGEALNIEAIETIREKMSGVYSPQLQLDFEKYPKPTYTLMAIFSCAPQNVDTLSGAIFNLLRTFQKQGPKPETLQKVKEQMIKEQKTAMQKNSTWLGYLQNKYFQDEADQLGSINRFEQRVNEVTMEDIIQFMKQYFALDHYVRVSLYPETMKPAIQTKTRR